MMPGLLRILPLFVKVVSFDATDTVIAMDEPFNVVYSRVANDHGIPVDSSLVATSFLKYMKNMSVSHPCFGFGSIGHVEWWKRLVVGCLEEVLFNHIQLETFVNALRRKEVAVVIVSNFDGRLWKILQDMNLYSLFDLIVASGEVGVEKPSPSIFEIVTNHYRLSNASELLHIGDSVQNDYLAARNFGANAILFDRSSLNSDVSRLDKISSFSQLQIL
ncbi:unnamed protein product [Angiostrongylus costaricensis]|uniref:HAD family hydrolase n=1 Tax=Angiostrongylus costaricensis TaxID=334426 RepID=A0A0R3PVT4_ANGCS|nr:unnamed protein product [Angiostrongylus costaricensis]